jgi:peptide/nickel transport system ATP-binding protein
LLRSFPDMRGARRELRGVPGTPPDLRDDFAGCPFGPRCSYAFEPCRSVPPTLRPVAARRGGAEPDRWTVACHLHDPDGRPDGPPAELGGAAPGAATPVTADDAISADSGGGER